VDGFKAVAGYEVQVGYFDPAVELGDPRDYGSEGNREPLADATTLVVPQRGSISAEVVPAAGVDVGIALSALRIEDIMSNGYPGQVHNPALLCIGEAGSLYEADGPASGSLVWRSTGSPTGSAVVRIVGGSEGMTVMAQAASTTPGLATLEVTPKGGNSDGSTASLPVGTDLLRQVYVQPYIIRDDSGMSAPVGDGDPQKDLDVANLLWAQACKKFVLVDPSPHYIDSLEALRQGTGYVIDSSKLSTGDPLQSIADWPLDNPTLGIRGWDRRSTRTGPRTDYIEVYYRERFPDKALMAGHTFDSGVIIACTGNKGSSATPAAQADCFDRGIVVAHELGHALFGGASMVGNILNPPYESHYSVGSHSRNSQSLMVWDSGGRDISRDEADHATLVTSY